MNSLRIATSPISPAGTGARIVEYQDLEAVGGVARGDAAVDGRRAGVDEQLRRGTRLGGSQTGEQHAARREVPAKRVQVGPGQRLGADADGPDVGEARVAGERRHEVPEQRGDGVDEREALCADPARPGRGIRTMPRSNGRIAAPLSSRGEDVADAAHRPAARIIDRRSLGPEPQPGHEVDGVVERPPVVLDDALGLAGGARGVDDRGEGLRRDAERGGERRRATPPRRGRARPAPQTRRLPARWAPSVITRDAPASEQIWWRRRAG